MVISIMNVNGEDVNAACTVPRIYENLVELYLSLRIIEIINNRGDFGRRCAKIVRAGRLFPANFAFQCFANYNFKDVKFSAL